VSAYSVSGVLVWLGLIVVADMRTRRIPNLLSLGGFVLGLAVLAATGQTFTQAHALSAISGFVVALLFTLPGYIFNILGAGDVKLLSAMAVLCGLEMMLQTYILASVSILVILLLQARFSIFNRSVGTARSKFIPFGAALALALAIILVFPKTLGFDKWGIDAFLFS
jgi:prepilin peptidase CpaA